MKAICQIVFYILSSLSLCAQRYYVRGEVKDESGNILQNVNILQQKTGYVFKSGSSGTFGIISQVKFDTLVFSMEGYSTEKIFVNAEEYVRVRLKMLSTSITNLRRDRLSSFTKGLQKDEQSSWYTGDETYASILENHFVNTKKFPKTSISLNIDRASYSNIRRFVSLRSIVPPDAVRVEEMLNYFNLNYTEPENNKLFSIAYRLSTCPWNPENQLLFLTLSAKKLNLDTLPPNNLVFLIDVSGSMDMPNRLPLLKSAFRLLVSNLRAKDSVAIVVYGGVTGVMLNSTGGNEKEKILKAIDELVPGGNTPGESGIKLAYSVARNHFMKNGNNRVILATDGDFNVGMKTEEELNELITRQKESGVYLTCLGVGMGNYKDSKIQVLANKGNGNFAYLDNFKEAEKVLLKEFTKTLYAIADDVYLTFDFNPEYVKEYRLIGFDNKVGVLRDTSSVIEGGEIGSGHSVIAIVEIIPTEINKGAIKDNYTTGKLADIHLNYKLPNNTKELEQSTACQFVLTPFDQIEKQYRFSASVAMFGSLLRNSSFLKNNSWDEIITLATTSSGGDDLLQNEFIELVQQAKTLYTKFKKEKKKRQ